MRLTDEQITSYQRLYLNAFGKPIPKAKALVQALALVRLVKVLTEPTAKEYKDGKTARKSR